MKINRIMIKELLNYREIYEEILQKYTVNNIETSKLTPS